MAFFALLWKARTIEKYKLNYEKEKINSIVMGNTQIEQTFSQRWRHYRYDTQKRISTIFKKWYPDGSGVSNFLLYLKTDQTFPNFLLKSMMGFVGGIILTYLCFMFFVFQLSISLIHSTIMSSIIGVLLTLGLAFSYRIRCLVFLLIPQLFSRVGRYTLTCYALVLILTGPATNTLKNSEVLSESMACTQEQIKTSVHQLNDQIQKPYHSLKDHIKLMVERFKAITTRVKLMVVRLNRLVLSIVGSIKSSFSWLQSISNVCNAKLETPYNRCSSLLQDGVEDYNTINSDSSVLLNIVYLAQAVCVSLKPIKSFCYISDFMDEAIIASIRKKLKNFTVQIRTLFHLEIYMHRSYSFSTNSTRSASQVAAGIVTEIRNRADPLLTWLSWSSYVTSLFLLLIIFRAKHYQHMYETRSRFDNRYITKELQDLDLKRQRQGRETVLPLNRRERAKYIKTTSFRLVTSEKVYLTRSAVFMAITTFKLLIHMIADYSLYWVLMTIRYHGRHQSHLMPGIPETGAHVTGTGFLARLFRSIVETLNIPLSKYAPAPMSCLPDPYPPDFRRYMQIGVLIFLLWFFALFEPYGLRLRHVIMGQYRPERAKARATWLYNHILRTRAGFMKFARRKLHREYKYYTETLDTFDHWLDSHIPFQCIKYLLGIGPKEPYCLLCGTSSIANDSDTCLTRCKTPKCPGTYCSKCFSDIGSLCTICLSPCDYGDLSDVSLENGSSSDDSDSGSEFDSTARNYENITLIDNVNRTSDSRSRWQFFTRTFSSRTEESFSLLESASFEYRQAKAVFKMGPLRINIEVRTIVCYNRLVRRGSTIYIQKRLKQKTRTKKEILDSYVSNEGIINVDICNKRTHDSTRSKKHYFTLDKTIINHRLMRRRRTSHGYVTLKTNQGVMKAVRFFSRNKTTLDSTEKKDDKENIKDHNNDNDAKTPDNNASKENSLKNKEIEADKSKKADKEKDKNEKPKTDKIKTSRHRVGHFHTLFSTHWKNVKSNLVSQPSKQINKEVESSEKKNHKRRKKRKKDVVSAEIHLKENEKALKDSRRIRHYRISAFLADLDWMKKDFKKSDKCISAIDESCRVAKRSCQDLQEKSADKNKLVAMVQLSNIPFQRREAPRRDHCHCVDKTCKCTESTEQFCTNKPLAKKAMHSLKQKVNTMVTSQPSSLIQKIMSSIQVTRKTSPCKYSSSVSLPKRTSFYRSFRNEVMNQNSGVIDTDVLFKNNDYADDRMPPSNLEMHQSLSIPTIISSILHPPACRMSFSNSIERQKTLVATRCKCDYDEPKRDPCPLPSPPASPPRKESPKPKRKKEKKKQRVKEKPKPKPKPVKEKPKKNRPMPKLPEGEICRRRLSSGTLSPTEISSTRLCAERQSSGNLSSERQSSEKLSPTRQSSARSSECEPEIKVSSYELPPRKHSSVRMSPERESTVSIPPCPRPQKKKVPQAPRRQVTSPPEKKYPTPPLVKKKPSASKIPLRVRMKHICSSIFGSGCTDKTCPNAKEKDRRLERDRLCAKKESSFFNWKDRIPRKNRECRQKCLPMDEFDDVEEEISNNIKRAKEIARCKERELEKIKEIHRHIEKEQEIEKKIEMEQARHREREKEIERELGLELARHRQREKNLMCDEDSQTPAAKPSIIKPFPEPKKPPPKPKPVPKVHKPEPKCEPKPEPKREPKRELKREQKREPKPAPIPSEPCPPSPCPGIVRQYCTTATQDSGQKHKKGSKKTKTSISVDAVICMCDEKVGDDPKITCTCATQYKKASAPSLNHVSCAISPTAPPKKMVKHKKHAPVCPEKPTPCVQVSSVNSELPIPHSKRGWMSPSVKHSITNEDSDVSEEDEPWAYECSPNVKRDSSAHVLLSPRNSSSINRMRCSVSTEKVLLIKKLKPKFKDSGVYAKQSPIHAEVSAECDYVPRLKDTSKCLPEYEASSNKRGKSRNKYHRHLSQITSPVAISRTTHSTSDFTTIISPKKTPKIREIKAKNTHVSKNDKIKAEKETVHKGTHCSSLWQRVCKKTKGDVIVERQRQLSLESSLCDTGNQSNFNDILSDTKSETSASSSTIRSDTDTKTDTTICTMATVDYDLIPRRTLYKVRVVTKSNQATSTEKTKLCDTGTLTYDWWSPMVERRPDTIILEKKKGYNMIDKQNRQFEEVQERRQLRNDAMGAIVADGRFVKFKSRTQVIPTGMYAIKNETLSPSRYLLESQKYYNELFAYNICPPLQVNEHIRYHAPRLVDREKCQNISGRRIHQRKTKRLDDCYSPRKQYSPRRRYTDSTRTSESPRKRPSFNYRNVSRYYLKINSGRKHYC